MTTLVSFELAKKLKEKGYDRQTINIYMDGVLLSLKSTISNSQFTTLRSCTAPTIAEVVMWLCEKHKIWIEVIVESPNYFGYSVCNIKNNTSQDGDYVSYKSPTEAYEAAIEYTLINLL